MKAINRLSVIRHKSKINKYWKHTDLFRILRKTDIWIVAYKNINNNTNSLTEEITKETLDGMIIEKLIRLRDRVVNENYQFKSINKIETPKSNSRKKSLELPTLNDKIVQEVIRLILEAIYEPCFSKQSFGFRKELRTQDVLEYMKQKLRWVDFIIAVDLEGAYSTIDHIQLCNILSDKIKDVRFLNLIRKLLKCGIFRTSFELSQGSIVSPILANIYFNELDEWVEKKANLVTQFQTEQRDKKYKQLCYQIGKQAEQMRKLNNKSKKYKILLKELKTLKKRRVKVSSLATNQIQIKYVRYANDWIIGIKGNQTRAKELKVEVSRFLKIRLKQIVHLKITDLRSGKVKFLGYEIYFPRTRKMSSYTGSGPRLTRRANPRLRFDIPMDSILRIMEDKGYIKKLIKGHRPISKASYTTLEDIVIVKRFAQVWRGLANYYSGCTNLFKLQYIHHLLHISCAMTLSHRHRSSTTKIFAKHGKRLTVFNGKISSSFPYQKEWSIMPKKIKK